MRKVTLPVIAAAAFALFNTDPRAEKSMNDSGSSADARYLWPVFPPDGWFHNLESSRKVGVQIMTPRPTDSDALIYVVASLKKKDLEVSIAENHVNMRQSAPSTKITKMPEVARAKTAKLLFSLIDMRPRAPSNNRWNTLRSARPGTVTVRCSS